MVTFHVKTIETHAVGVSAGVATAIVDWLTVKAKDYWFSPAYKRGIWDGCHRFCSTPDLRFPTGLLPVVCRELQKRHQPYTLQDYRGLPPEPHTPPALRITLREYQHAAVNAVLQNTLDLLTFPRGVIKIGTGGGKTAVAAAIVQAYAPAAALIVVHRKDLLHQTVQRLQDYLGEPVGSIGDQIWDPKRCTVGMVQTLGRQTPNMQEFLRRQHVFLADESHHLPSATFLNVAKRCPAYVRVAISATPFKANDVVHAYRLQGATGALLYEQSAAHLVTEGHLAPVQVEYVQIQTPTTMRGLAYAQAYTEGIIQNTERNQAIIARAQDSAAQGHRVLILVSRLEHGAFLSARLACPFLSGKESSEARRHAASQFQHGRPPILVVTTIWDEGIDAPEIDHVILAGGGKSETQVLQRIGRGMRRKADGRGLTVTDFLDLTHRNLTKHSRDRFLACQAAKFSARLLS